MSNKDRYTWLEFMATTQSSSKVYKCTYFQPHANIFAQCFNSTNVCPILSYQIFLFILATCNGYDPSTSMSWELYNLHLYIFNKSIMPLFHQLSDFKRKIKLKKLSWRANVEILTEQIAWEKAYVWYYGKYARITILHRDFSKAIEYRFCKIMVDRRDSYISIVIPDIDSCHVDAMNACSILCHCQEAT
jgi:hypothetical protein